MSRKILRLARGPAVYTLVALVPAGIALYLLHVGDAGPRTAAARLAPVPSDQVGKLLLAGVVTLALAGMMGLAFRAVGQSPVVGEMIAGILLGPSVLGVISPELENRLFPAAVMPLLNLLAQVGVVFFLFLVGLDLPLTMLRRVWRRALPIGHAAVAVPFALGVALALALRDRYQPPGVRGLPFLLFVALSVSVTAFPVLARILADRNLIGTHIGALGLAAAAVDDVTAWCVLGVVIAEVRNSSSLGVVRTTIEVVAFAAVLWLAIRPGLVYVLRFVESRVPTTYSFGAIIAAFPLLCAVITNEAGVHPIFGAFLAGVVMPRSSRSVVEFAEKTKGFTVWVLLPLFFATIGLQTRLEDVFTSDAILPLLGVLVVAIAAKMTGVAIAALMCGEDQRSALGLGVMMNCRGLTEIVVLNIGLSLGVINTDLFSVLVVMTLVTTMMTDPLLRLLRIGQVDARGQAAAQQPATTSPRDLT